MGALHGTIVGCCFDAGAVVGVEDGGTRSGYHLEASRTGKLISVSVLETSVFNKVIFRGRHIGNRTKRPEKTVVVSIK